jgi:hypothetical protein
LTAAVLAADLPALNFDQRNFCAALILAMCPALILRLADFTDLTEAEIPVLLEMARVVCAV